MKFSYYPGCTLKTKAKKLDIYAQESLKKLGVNFSEVKEWQCCGAVYPQAKDEIATKLSAVRTLVSARDEDSSLLTICSACHQVMKRVNNDMAYDKDMNLKANNYMDLDRKYNGETKVVHYLELLRDYVGFNNLKEKVVNPFTGKKIAAYYGCLLLRPSSVMAFDNPENPKIMEDFITAIGGTPVIYPFRNECCGAYLSVKDSENCEKKSNKVLNSAKDKGADIIITACPLCMYNLTEHSNKALPVYYFTELLAKALGVEK